MNVKNCVISKQTNRPAMSLVYDAITGPYLMTQPDEFVREKDFLGYVTEIHPPVNLTDFYEKLRRYNVPLLSGKSVFSLALPPGLFYQNKNILIQDGILITGVLTKSSIGLGHNTITQAIHNDFGALVTADYLTNVYKISSLFLTKKGFTVGIKDCLPEDESAKKAINSEIERAEIYLESLGLPPSDSTEARRQEDQIRANLNRAQNIGAKLSQEIFGDDNNLRIMSLSGAKGNDSNIAQISGLLGQQFTKDNRRPIASIDKGRRCLPFFEQNSLEPEARGFCHGNFLSGLDPAEFVFHAYTSRFGLIDKSINTAIVGDFNRHVLKTVEDLKTGIDKQVISSGKAIKQFLYGFDSMETSKLENVRTKKGIIPSFINVKRLSGRLNNKYGFKLIDGKWIEV